jgi:hypothetical protein
MYTLFMCAQSLSEIKGIWTLSLQECVGFIPMNNAQHTAGVEWLPVQIHGRDVTADVNTEGANQKIVVLGVFRCPRLICPYLGGFCTDCLEN